MQDHTRIGQIFSHIDGAFQLIHGFDAAHALHFADGQRRATFTRSTEIAAVRSVQRFEIKFVGVESFSHRLDLGVRGVIEMTARTKKLDAFKAGVGDLSQKFRGNFARYKRIRGEESAHNLVPRIIFLENARRFEEFSLLTREYQEWLREYLHGGPWLVASRLVAHGGAVVAGIGGSEAVTGLRVDADGIYKPDVTLAFRGVSVGVKSVLEYRGKFLFQHNFIWQPLMMETRGVDRRLCVHAQTHPVDDTQECGGNYRRASGGTGNKTQFTVAQQYGWSHGAERAVIGRNGVGI